MAVDWELYVRLLGNGASTNSRDVKISQAVESFLGGVESDPAYQENAIVEGTVTPIVATRSSSLKCAIKAAPATDIHIGDIVQCYNENWIVVELYTDKIGLINGTMWMCNDTIHFQNRSASVNSRYCVVDDGTYSKKSTDTDAFVMVNTYKVYLSMDDATQQLFVDKRLAFGTIYSSSGDTILEVYKIIGIDIKSKNIGAGSHLMVLTLQRDVYDSSADSIVNNLCDVFAEQDGTSVPSATGSCAITGRDTIRIGTTRRYSVAFTDAAGTVQSSVIANWELNVQNEITLVANGNTCEITVPLDASLVGQTLTLTVTDIGGLYGEYTKEVQVITVG